MLRLVGPDAAEGAGVVTGAAEGEVDEPPQDTGSRQRARTGTRIENMDGRAIKKYARTLQPG
jgi:hypothetical protein